MKHLLNAPGIYKIVNLINGKVYVGSAISVRQRCLNHLRRLRMSKHDNSRLQRSWEKYGEEFFAFSVIEYVGCKTLLIQREQHFIELMEAATRNNFNICKTAGSTLGLKMSLEARKKMSEARKGRKNSAEAIRKTAAANTGLKRSDETKKKISEAMKGRKMHPNTAAAIKAAHLGATPSKETCERISKSNKGRIFTEAHRKKISEGMKGNVNTKGSTLSEETKLKMSISATARELLKRLRSSV